MKTFVLLCILEFMKCVSSSIASFPTTENVMAETTVTSDTQAIPCLTRTNKSGSCLRVELCRHGAQLARAGLQDTVCKQDGRVCCPLEDPFIDSTKFIERHTTEESSVRTKSNFHQARHPNFTQAPVFSMRKSQENWTSVNLTSHFSNSTSNHVGRNREDFVSVFPEDCGKINAALTRIVGGQTAVIGAWPWMVGILYTTSTQIQCGGTLVTAKHVLTAAHCIVNSKGLTMRPRFLRVRLGEHDTSRTDEGTNPIDMSVITVVKHNRFDIETFQNDVALLALDSIVSFTHHIAPICLPFDGVMEDDLSERNAFVTGWGTLSFGGGASTTLQQVQLRIWQNNACEHVFDRVVPITDKNLCAGGEDKDACRGDSGGPLALSNDGKFYLVGLVSFGKKCADPGVPGVYTRITSFLSWIEDQVMLTNQ